MKKITLSIIAVLAFGFANAQEVKFGVKAGMNLSTWTGDTEGVDLKSKVGFNGGGFVAIQFSEKLTLQPEVLFSTQGVKVDNVEGDVNGANYMGNVRFNLSYINVPVMVKYYVVKDFNIEVGPQIGFLTSAETVTKINGFNGKHKENVKEIFESVDFGLNFGAGYDFTENISAGVRYNLGLSNIAKTEEGDNTKLKNSVFSLLVGFKF
ncbi:PorT family protein [Flavobacterium sp. LS1R47]|uniref:PorT family protein n=1 Tax=Flavobacterium frigoritolerans TaxID=2987686 RepID=A0A9X3C9P2_9FLAO|nr:porin family protein [Flavobacterium frigoritolerans]MCV9934171.1 PorT family protein [Flavobacterium frigoritolerans]